MSRSEPEGGTRREPTTGGEGPTGDPHRQGGNVCVREGRVYGEQVVAQPAASDVSAVERGGQIDGKLRQTKEWGAGEILPPCAQLLW